MNDTELNLLLCFAALFAIVGFLLRANRRIARELASEKQAHANELWKVHRAHQATQAEWARATIESRAKRSFAGVQAAMTRKANAAKRRAAEHKDMPTLEVQADGIFH